MFHMKHFIKVSRETLFLLCYQHFLSVFNCIQVDYFKGIPYIVDKFHHVVTADDQRGSIVVGMETYPLGIHQVAVNKKGDLVINIVHKSKKRDASWLHSKVTHHTLGTGKTEFPLVQPVLHVMNVHRETTVHYDEVMPVAFMVAEEEVLA